MLRWRSSAPSGGDAVFSSITDTGLTAGRVVIVGTGGLLEDDADFTYNKTTNALTTTTFVGALTGTASGNLVSGGALGTPSSGVVTNLTGTAAGVSIGGNAATATTAGTVTNATQAAITSAANLATVGTITTGVWNTSQAVTGTIVTASSYLNGPLRTGGAQLISGSETVSAGISSIRSVAAATSALNVWNSDTAGDNKFQIFYTELIGSITERGSITYNRGGGLTAYNVTSDYRLKDLGGSYDDAGQVIDSVPVHLGRMKGADLWRPMFVAHEVQEFAPWAVTGGKDAVKTLQVMGEKGEVVDMKEVIDPQQLSESALVAILWAEIQSLRKRIAALE